MASCRAPRARCCFSSRGGGGARPHNPAARLCSLRPGLCTAAAPQRRSVTAQAARRGRDIRQQLIHGKHVLQLSSGCIPVPVGTSSQPVIGSLMIPTVSV